MVSKNYKNVFEFYFILCSAMVLVLEIFPYRRTYLSLIQYHDCWWPGDIRSQGISRHGIDLVLHEYSGFSTKRVKSSYCWDKVLSNIASALYHGDLVTLKFQGITRHYIKGLMYNIDGLAQDYSNSSALAMEFLQSCAKPSISWQSFYSIYYFTGWSC